MIAGFAIALFVSGLCLPISNRIDEDLVYCPLQKAWVERIPEKRIEFKFDFDKMCAAGGLKDAFVRTLITTSSINVTENPESLFFTFVESGEIEAATHSLPDDSDFFIPGKLPAFTVRQNDSIAKIGQRLSVSLLARPPTDQKLDDYPPSRLTDLSSDRGSLRPRAPPIS